MEFTISDLIAWISLLVSILLAVYTWYNSNRLKKLESNLEIQKNKSLLNDKVNRDIFEKFIQSFIKLLLDKKEKNEKEKLKDEEELKKNMLDIKKFLLINWNWWLVREFNNFVLLTQKENKKDIDLYIAIDKLLKQFRLEIWVNNKWLKENDLLQLFVNEDINLKLKSNN